MSIIHAEVSNDMDPRTLGHFSEICEAIAVITTALGLKEAMLNVLTGKDYTPPDNEFERDFMRGKLEVGVLLRMQLERVTVDGTTPIKASPDSISYKSD